MRLKNVLELERISRAQFLVAFFGYCFLNLLIFGVAGGVDPLLGINIFGLVNLIHKAMSSDAFLIIKLKEIHYSIFLWQVFLFLLAKLLLLFPVSLRLKDRGKNPNIAFLILLPDFTVIFLFFVKLIKPLHLTPFSLRHPNIELLTLITIYFIQFVLYIDCLFFPAASRKESLPIFQERHIDNSYCLIHKVSSSFAHVLLFSNTLLMCIAAGNISLFAAGFLGFIRPKEIIGEMYLYGRIYEVNYDRALYWLESAQSQGSLLAKNKVGIMYAQGLGVPKDIDKAREIWLDAAEKGFAPSQYNLGELYRTGDGISQDFEAAESWYQKAADLGYGDAQFKLSYMGYSDEYLDWKFRDSPQTLEELNAKRGIKNGPSEWR